MKKNFFALVITLTLIFAGFTSAQQDPVRVGGQPMYPNKTIVDNAVNSADHTTLVAAVKAAGLVETLKGPGPFTVLAPINAAFSSLPAGTVENLLKPENKDKLVGILTYHVIPGRLNFQAIQNKIKEGKGQTTVKTVQGSTLTLKKNGDNIIVEDAKGGVANITITNVNQSNGVIHVIDHVLLPN
ncbi:MAG: fasciclin domain-containing protein [Acidobacteriota bacterium]